MRSWSLVLLPFLLTGCGIAGGTSARKVSLNPSVTGPNLTRSAQVGTVTARTGAGVNRAIGTYNIGKFDDADLATLRETVRLSLPSATASAPLVHIEVQHFGQTFTNSRGACLAVIDWCAADGSLVLASERFYAAYDTGEGLTLQTMGAVKSRVLHAAATRIVERALAAANKLPAPVSPALTYDLPEPALANLPTHMAAMPGSAVGAIFQAGVLGGLEGETQFLPTALPPRVNWADRLAHGAPLRSNKSGTGK